MSLFEDTNPRALKELLADVHSRTMVLLTLQDHARRLRAGGEAA